VKPKTRFPRAKQGRDSGGRECRNYAAAAAASSECQCAVPSARQRNREVESVDVQLIAIEMRALEVGGVLTLHAWTLAHETEL
jgi:hypothetical protein